MSSMQPRMYVTLAVLGFAACVVPRRGPSVTIRIADLPSPAIECSGAAAAPSPAASGDLAAAAVAKSSPVSCPPMPSNEASVSALEVLPPLPPIVRGRHEHATHVGYSRDGHTLGACIKDGAEGTTRCTLLPWEEPALGAPPVSAELLHDRDVDKGGVDPKAHGELARRLQAFDFSVRPAEFSHARRLVARWNIAVEPVDPPRTTLRAGLAVFGEPTPPLAMHVPVDGVHGLHPEAIVLSPDGARIGVIAHAVDVDGRDVLGLAQAKVATLAALAYDDVAMRRHARRQWREAIEWYDRALAAEPAADLVRLRRAGALMRLSDPRAKEALASALIAGGPPMIGRVMGDPDFAEARTEPWFSAMLGNARAAYATPELPLDD